MNKVELRLSVPRHVVDVIDAVAVARGRTRNAIVLSILSKWIAKRSEKADAIDASKPAGDR